MEWRNRGRDLVLLLCVDVDGHGRERCEVNTRVLEESDRGRNGRCGYGLDDYAYGKYDCGVIGHDGNDHDVYAHFHAGDLHGNDPSGRVHRGSVHAHGAHGQRRSYQLHSLASQGC